MEPVKFLIVRVGL